MLDDIFNTELKNPNLRFGLSVGPLLKSDLLNPDLNSFLKPYGNLTMDNLLAYNNIASSKGVSPNRSGSSQKPYDYTREELTEMLFRGTDNAKPKLFEEVVLVTTSNRPVTVHLNKYTKREVSTIASPFLDSKLNLDTNGVFIILQLPCSSFIDTNGDVNNEAIKHAKFALLEQYFITVAQANLFAKTLLESVRDYKETLLTTRANKLILNRQKQVNVIFFVNQTLIENSIGLNIGMEVALKNTEDCDGIRASVNVISNESNGPVTIIHNTKFFTIKPHDEKRGNDRLSIRGTYDNEPHYGEDFVSVYDEFSNIYGFYNGTSNDKAKQRNIIDSNINYNKGVIADSVGLPVGFLELYKDTVSDIKQITKGLESAIEAIELDILTTVPDGTRNTTASFKAVSTLVKKI